MNIFYLHKLMINLIEEVTFDQVLEQFYLEHSVDTRHEQNTNQEAQELLSIANKTFSQWNIALLNSEDVLNVVLPWHVGCGGSLTLVPRSGLTVKQTVKKLIKIQKSYFQENIVCSQKILRMGQSEFSTLFLSTQPILHQDYSEINIPGELFHLDGLHRMVSWGFYGRLTQNIQIKAYIAGNF